MTEEDADSRAAREERIREDVIAFAKANKKQIAKSVTDDLPSEKDPVSVFMAGSPGAGKTEASLALLSEFEADGTRVLRIDPDDLRRQFEAYDGSNAWLFQGGVSILVDKILDRAFERSLSFLLDGTLSNYVRAERNVKRSLNKGRKVQILYVYLDPLQAWRFVQAREALENRRIPVDSFVDQYFEARNVVNALKRAFGKQISVDLLQKPIEGSERLYKAGIDAIDNHIPETYDRERLMKILKGS